MALTRTKGKCNMTAAVTTIWHYTYLIIISRPYLRSRYWYSVAFVVVCYVMYCG